MKMSHRAGSTGRVALSSALMLLMPLAVSFVPARAGALLKLKGQGAAPIRMKALKADIEIDGPFARTTQLMTFQNEASDRVEADFIFQAPPGAIVSGFAYWYGEEKVVARIVEKERAATIYRYITSRMRDPALVEMIGKNTFRARIFPIEPNADLKVELKMVQTLASDRDGAVFSLQLQPEEAGKGTLESLQVNARVRPGTAFDTVFNNYALPQQVEDGATKIQLQQSNFRPARDLRIRLKARPVALRTALYAAPDGGSDGFFALSLMPNRALKSPVLSARGVRFYDVMPARLPSLKAGQECMVVGRYKGSGEATIALDERGKGQVSLAQPVVFAGQSERENLAGKLWASKRIETLSVKARNKSAVTALSTRFTLPSKWTSWLAVPKAELERFHTEKLTADYADLGRLISLEVADGRGQGRTARALKTRFEALGKQLGYTSQNELPSYYDATLRTLASNLAQEKYAARPNRRRMAQTRQQMARLQRAGAGERGESSEPIYILEEEMRVASGQLAEEQVAGRPNSRRARMLRAELKRLEKRMNSGDSDWGVRQAAQQQTRDLAVETVRERYASNPNPKRLAALRRRLNRAARGLNESPQAYLQSAEQERIADKIQDAEQRLAEEVLAGRETGEDARKLQTWLESLPRNGDYNREWMRKRAYSARAHETASRLLLEQKNPNPDTTRIASLQQELDRLSAQSGTESESFVGWEKMVVENGQTVPTKARDYYMRQGDPLLSIEAPMDARQVVALMPNGDIKKLVFNPATRKWEARFDIPTHQNEGDYQITVIIVAHDGARKQLKLSYHVDLTGPKGSARAQVAAKHDGTAPLRLELDGDADTARVFVLLPWGEKVELKPSTLRPHRFFALAAVPSQHDGKTARVTYVLTDKAHNRTRITVDLSK